MKTNYPELEAKLEKAINYYLEELDSIRAGRANTAVLNKISVDYYGTMTPIPQVAAVASPDARTITIQPWDASTLKEIEKAILTSEIGINPQNDGKVIRLNFPPLTEERRKEIVKDVRKKGEDAKVALRNQRRDALDKLKALKKANQITEDDESNGEKKIQNLTDKFCKEVDAIASAKEKEIMEL